VRAPPPRVGGPPGGAGPRADAGQRSSVQYDWEVVADKVFEVYKLAIDMGSPATSGPRRTRHLFRRRKKRGESLS